MFKGAKKIKKISENSSIYGLYIFAQHLT